MSKLLRVLQTSQLPILYQLRLEEALLRATTDNWLIVNDGTRDPTIVMGISGKPKELVHLEAAHKAAVPIIKRFSGGGTVIVDRNTVFTTLIMSQVSLPDVEPFPKPIMEFAAEV
jgi:lipoate-protein ligase A